MIELPHSEECERAVLGAILLDPSAAIHAVARLEAQDFHFEKHQTIFQAMATLTADGTTVDLRTLQAWLESRQELVGIGGLSYLTGLDLELADFAQVSKYAEILRELSLRRRMILEAERLSRDLQKGLRAPDAADRMEALAREVAEASSHSRLEPAASIATQLLDEKERRVEEGKPFGLSTGFTAWDQETGGLGPWLVILAGRPGMGKTTFALNVAGHVAAQGGPVAFFSLEMGKDELMERLLASRLGIYHTGLRLGQISNRQWDLLREDAQALEQVPLYIDDGAGESGDTFGVLTPAEIAAKCRRLRSREGLALVVVDYLQLMEMPGRFENRNQEIAKITRQFKLLSKRIGVPILLLSQLNRESAKKGAKPRLTDLRESGAIEQDADLVVFVHREELYERSDPGLSGRALLIQEKMRNGMVGELPLVFEGEFCRFMGDE